MKIKLNLFCFTKCSSKRIPIESNFIKFSALVSLFILPKSKDDRARCPANSKIKHDRREVSHPQQKFHPRALTRNSLCSFSSMSGFVSWYKLTNMYPYKTTSYTQSFQVSVTDKAHFYFPGSFVRKRFEETMLPVHQCSSFRL